MEENSINKSLYKILLYLIKNIPALIAVLCFINTMTSLCDIDIPFISYIGGVSFLPLLFMYLASYAFKFCTYHRLFIHYITFNWLLNIVDLYIHIPILDRTICIIYLIIFIVFLILATTYKFKK